MLLLHRHPPLRQGLLVANAFENSLQLGVLRVAGAVRRASVLVFHRTPGIVPCGLSRCQVASQLYCASWVMRPPGKRLMTGVWWSGSGGRPNPTLRWTSATGPLTKGRSSMGRTCFVRGGDADASRHCRHLDVEIGRHFVQVGVVPGDEHARPPRPLVTAEPTSGSGAGPAPKLKGRLGHNTSRQWH